MLETLFIMLESLVDGLFPTWTHVGFFLFGCAVALWAGFHFHGGM
jgi:hypothetical protein